MNALLWAYLVFVGVTGLVGAVMTGIAPPRRAVARPAGTGADGRAATAAARASRHQVEALEGRPVRVAVLDRGVEAVAQQPGQVAKPLRSIEGSGGCRLAQHDLTVDDQFRKLALVVETAAEVWGE